MGTEEPRDQSSRVSEFREFRGPVGAMPCRRPPLPLRATGFSSQRADTGVCPYGELRQWAPRNRGTKVPDPNLRQSAIGGGLRSAARDQSSRVSEFREFRGPVGAMPCRRPPRPLRAKGFSSQRADTGVCPYGELRQWAPRNRAPISAPISDRPNLRQSAIRNLPHPAKRRSPQRADRGFRPYEDPTPISDSLRSAARDQSSRVSEFREFRGSVGAMPCRRPPLPLRAKGFSSQRADTGVCPYGELRQWAPRNRGTKVPGSLSFGVL